MSKTEKTIAELENEFYSKPLCLSYSGLNKLLFSPKVFYNHYILQEREDKTDKYLIEGKVIHCLLLDDGSFDDNFILMPSNLPTDNTRKIVDKVFESIGNIENKDISLSSLNDAILTQLKEANLHQALKTDEQRIAKIVTEDSISYFEFLKNKESKDLIDSELLNRCATTVDILKSNQEVCELLGLYKSEMENIDVFNEKELAASAEDLNLSIGLKGILDSYQVNHDKKILYINDLKTTSKTIADFPETVQFYRYDMQAAIYNRLVKHVEKEIINDNWKIIFNFIVADKYNQVYVFKVSDETMENWSKDLDLKIEEAYWHYKNKNYELPYIFATGQVTL